MPYAAETPIEILIPGEAVGDVLRMERPLSFWGGVDPASARVTDPRHPQYNQSLTGKIVAMERVIGSSSGSSVLLELLALGIGPAGLILSEADAILSLAVIVAREMGYPVIPIFLAPPDRLMRLPARVHMAANGTLTARI